MTNRVNKFVNALLKRLGTQKTEAVLEELHRTSENKILPFHTIGLLITTELNVPIKALFATRGFDGRARQSKLLFTYFVYNNLYSNKYAIAKFLKVGEPAVTKYLQEFTALNPRLRNHSDLLHHYENISVQYQKIFTLTKQDDNISSTTEAGPSTESNNEH
jgi:hypothetical protein